MYYNLQMERKKVKLTQEKMAALLELNIATYRKKEAGLYPFKLEEAKKVQAIINAHREKKHKESLSLDYLFLRE